MTGHVLQEVDQSPPVHTTVMLRGEDVLVSDRALVAVLRDERVKLLRAPRAVGVWYGLGRGPALAVYPVEDGREDLFGVRD